MVDAAVVGRDIVVVQKETFLYCKGSVSKTKTQGADRLRRLKLVTGVEISTRPVSRSGSPGRSVKMANRRTAAPMYRPAVRPGVTLAPSITQSAMAGTWEVKRSKSNLRWMMDAGWRLGVESCRVGESVGNRGLHRQAGRSTVLAGTQVYLIGRSGEEGHKKVTG